MKRNSYLLFYVCMMFSHISLGQYKLPNSDSLYYDAWVGSWYQEENNTVSGKPTFVVKRALYHSSYEEYWMGAGGNFSIAWRAWDSRTQQWDFAWISTDGLFQVWDGKKVNGNWYIYKTFIINNKEILSRQAFILQIDSTLVRTSEHSDDAGTTWRLRFQEKYRKR